MVTALVEEADGDPVGAMEAMDTAISIAEEGGYTGLRAEVLLEKGRVLAARGDRAGARECYEAVREIWEDVGNASGIEEISRILEELGGA